ncbi:hypothetical protein [Dactylosporangium sp. NPDC051541]|uniref:hypothetical protein n=1 Tax=Dactylosporangium sp. NPDC051541 TaxID=3363977 RepID=UPI0037AFE614
MTTSNMTARIHCLPDAPQADADLYLSRTSAYLGQDDGDPLLVLVDADTTVCLEAGAASPVEVIAAAEQIADTALRFAELVRDACQTASHLRLVGAAGPACMVPFDERAGCGVNVALAGRRTSSLVGLSFVTLRRACTTHDLTLAQATRLRDELDAVLRRARLTTADTGLTDVSTVPNSG